ncbi:hypothetical protein CsSME_00024607 [Camellia sinensis var. sinensis]
MEEAKDTAASRNPNPKESVVCEECKVEASKYKCPGCSIRSCSLPCVKAHKERTACTGKRQQTHFVPLSHFDDNLLLSGTKFHISPQNSLSLSCFLNPFQIFGSSSNFNNLNTLELYLYQILILYEACIRV